jgi:AraC family transcriptional regulator
MRVLSPRARGLSVEVRDGSAAAFVTSRQGVTLPGSRIPAILGQLHRELRVQDRASAFAVQGLVLQATAELLREKGADPSGQPLWVKQTAEFLDDNVAERLDMKRLTAVAGIGARDLLMGFRKFFGCTPTQYLRARRITTARQRLAETTEPIARVASEVGFYDQAHFCHEFKKVTGCSPREYRALVGRRECGEGFLKGEIRGTL